MGVTGLWDLISPVGHRVSNDFVRNKILAVDASIWLTQFVKAMRDAEGAKMRNAHLLGILRRCLKLLFLAVKPVMIFDGETPVIKRKTLARRYATREQHAAKLRRLAEKLLINRLKQSALRHVVPPHIARNAARITARKDKKNIQQQKLLPFTQASNKDIENDNHNEQNTNSEENKDETTDNKPYGNDDEEIHIEEEEEEVILPNDIDVIDDDTLVDLPSNVQSKVLKQMKLQHRARHREDMMKRQNDPTAFSQTQIEGFLRHTALNKRINRVRNAININTGAQNRIASDSTRQYFFKENSTVVEYPAPTNDVSIASNVFDDSDDDDDEELGNSASTPALDLLARIRAEKEASDPKRARKLQQSGEEEKNMKKKSENKSGIGWASKVLSSKGSLGLGQQHLINNIRSAEEDNISEEEKEENDKSDSDDDDDDDDDQWEDGNAGSKDIGVDTAVFISPSTKNAEEEKKTDIHNENNAADNDDDNDEDDVEWVDGAENEEEEELKEYRLTDQIKRIEREGRRLMTRKDFQRMSQAVLKVSGQLDKDGNRIPVSKTPKRRRHRLLSLYTGDSSQLTLDSNDNSLLGIDSSVGEQPSNSVNAVPTEAPTGQADLGTENGESNGGTLNESGNDNRAQIGDHDKEEIKKNDVNVKLKGSVEDATKTTAASDMESISIELEDNGKLISDSVKTLSKSPTAVVKSSTVIDNAQQPLALPSTRESDSDEHTKKVHNIVNTNESKNDTQPAHRTEEQVHSDPKFPADHSDEIDEITPVPDKDKNQIKAVSEYQNDEEGVDEITPVFKTPEKTIKNAQENKTPSRAELEEDAEIQLAIARSVEDQKKAHGRDSTSHTTNEAVQIESEMSPTKGALDPSSKPEATATGRDKRKNPGLNDTLHEEDLDEITPVHQPKKPGNENESSPVWNMEDEEALLIAESAALLNHNDGAPEKETRKSGQPLSADGVKKLQQQLEAEEEEIRRQKSSHQAGVDTVSDEMYAETRDLLKLLGIPYLQAPTEAEAQCAFLNLNKIVDGVISEDSDSFLFGAKTVYRKLFASDQFAEAYEAVDIAQKLGLDRKSLIRLAYLLGSDYTAGVRGVGVVNSMEILEAFRGDKGLVEFREWMEKVTLLDEEPNEDILDNENDLPDAVRQRFCWKHRNMKRNWEIRDEEFPNAAVAEAYWNPNVNNSLEKFNWGRIDFEGLAKFCWDKFAWPSEKFNTYIGPVRQELQTRGGPQQRRIDEFFKPHRFAKIRSERLQDAVMGMVGEDAEDLMAPIVPKIPKRKRNAVAHVAEPDDEELLMIKALEDVERSRSMDSVEPEKSSSPAPKATKKRRRRK